AGASALARLLEGLIYGVGTSDPVTLAGVSALLALTALVATWLPARRASRVAPVEAMREERGGSGTGAGAGTSTGTGSRTLTGAGTLTETGAAAARLAETGAFPVLVHVNVNVPVLVHVHVYVYVYEYVYAYVLGVSSSAGSSRMLSRRTNWRPRRSSSSTSSKEQVRGYGMWTPTPPISSTGSTSERSELPAMRKRRGSTP